MIHTKNDLKKYAQLGLLLSVLSLPACTQSVDFFNDIVRISPDPAPKSNNFPQTAENLEAPPPLILKPPSIEERALEPGQTGRSLDNQGLPVFEPEKGLKAQDLFKEDIRDTSTRFRRLEKAVGELRRDLDATLPAIRRLIAIEADIKDLVLQLENVFEEKQNLSTLPVTEVVEPAEDQNSPTNILAPEPKITPSAPAVQPQPKLTEKPQEPSASQQSQPVLKGDPALDPNIKYIDPAPKKESASNPQVENSAPDAQIDGVAVKEFRFGHYPDKSRLVFDLTAPSRYRVDIDEIEKLMVVEFEEAKWLAPKTASYTKNPILKKYEVQDNGEGGVLIVFELRHEAQIAKELMLDALKGGGKRLFFDLKSPAIHR